MQRFMDKVLKTPEGCWLWIGAKDTPGYGRFFVSKEHGLDGAHRVSYTLFRGSIPEGLHVCHTCDVKLCVNPDHLFLGTNKENHHDYFRKYGKIHSAGEYNARSKLTVNKVLAIRRLMAQGKFKAIHIASVFGIHWNSVYRINRREAWSHI